mmetsp:Transcript_1125/g.2437  ORF Transcript_1125/g.2437 Transcript_1125/m.2437 type:complete len:156 (+) Transcript_1125:159-626(+)
MAKQAYGTSSQRTDADGEPPLLPASAAWGDGWTADTLSMVKGAFAVAGSVMFTWVVYTCWTDGTPFRKELLTPWMVCTLWDFYTNQLIFYAWAYYKEDTPLARAVVLLLMIGLGSVTTCFYILYHLMKLSPGQGMKELLLNPKHLATKSRSEGDT